MCATMNSPLCGAMVPEGFGCLYCFRLTPASTLASLSITITLHFSPPRDPLPLQVGIELGHFLDLDGVLHAAEPGVAL